MIAATVLAILAALGSPDLLDEARAAFARGDYARAEALALQAATPPRAGAALYLAGLARFRSGRAAQALEALDGSTVDDAPAPAEWHYNRAACLDELGRHGEAEAEFVAAAELDPALSAVALVNAGFAALDGGALERARALAARARRAASGAAGELVSDLEARVSAASAPPPAEPASAARRGAAWEGLLRIAGGWDSDALQTGLVSGNEFVETTAAATPSALATTDVQISARVRALEPLRAKLTYSFTQLAYAAAAAADRSTQQHGLAATLELPVSERLRLGTSLEGAVAFTGLRAFRGLQSSAGARLFAALDESRRTTTRIDLGYAHKLGLASEFDYLTGDRVDAIVGQEVRLGRAVLAAGYRFQLEDLGTSRQQSSVACPAGACTEQLLESFAYAASAGWLSARAAVARWIDVEVSGGLERRDYLSDDTTSLVFPGQAAAVTDRRRRHDLRWLGGAAATVSLSRGVAVVLRYDLVVNRSDLDGATSGGRGPELDAIHRSFDKHVLTLGTAVAW